MTAPAPRNELLAIVPAYNEEATVGAVVAELRARAPFLDVLVVDDGSTDATAERAIAAGALLISHDSNRGIGATVRTGMEYALREGYRTAVQVDGDGQHDPSQVYAVLAPIVAGKADVVVGSRFLGAEGYSPPRLRRAGMSVLAGAVRSATGLTVTDTTSGFRAMNRRALAFLVSNYSEDYAETEALVLMNRAGLTFTEVPVTMRKRAAGASSIRRTRCLGFMVKVLGRIALDVTGIRMPRPASPLSEPAGALSAADPAYRF